jgi:hypothetical protein
MKGGDRPSRQPPVTAAAKMRNGYSTRKISDKPPSIAASRSKIRNGIFIISLLSGQELQRFGLL